ncbi:hypothetical protein JCM8208_001555 [Rhodotorula glutinis]
MSSRGSSPAPSAGVFDGLTFLVHGHQGKHTKAAMTRLIEQNGGSTTRHASSDYLSHLVCERDLFAQHTASAPDPVLREVLDSNEQKRKDAGPDQKSQRVWIVPPEWVDACIKKKGRRLDEEKWDLARNADSVRASGGGEQGSTSSRKKGKSGGSKRRRSDADGRDKKPQVKKKRSEASPSTSVDVKREKVKQETQDKPKPAPRASSSSSASTKTGSGKTTVDGPEHPGQEHDLAHPLSASQTKIGTSSSSKVVPRSAPMAGGKPESKPVVSVNRTFIKPASQQQQQQSGQKKGMWGGLKRAVPKALAARPPPVETSGEREDIKGKGKARATETPDDDLSDDDDALKKSMEKMADGQVFDDSGLSSLEDDD